MLVVFSCNHGRQAEAGNQLSNESHQQSICQYSSSSAAPFPSFYSYKFDAVRSRRAEERRQRRQREEAEDAADRNAEAAAKRQRREQDGEPGLSGLRAVLPAVTWGAAAMCPAF